MSIFGVVCVACLLVLAHPASSKPTPTKMRCHGSAFEGALVAGQSFEREIGGGLTLRFVPQNFGDAKAVLSGWRIALSPAAQKVSTDGTKDFISPVNPPLRFNPWQDIGTSYGIAAEKKLQHTITYAFVLSDEDYRRIEDVTVDALWPYSARDPGKADERYVSTLAALKLGELRLVPLRVTTDNGGQGIRQLRFRVEIAVPDSFKLSPRFADHRSVCPSRRE